MIQAEAKPSRFGETLAQAGNPEASRVKSTAVETRRLVCLRCDTQLKGQQRKFCSQKCSSYYHKLQKGDFNSPGVGSGNNQWGEDNHQYKTGIGTFRSKALEAYGNVCSDCGKDGEQETLDVHHIDENRKNNVLENLKVVCRSCHKKYYIHRDELGRFATNIKR